MTRILSLEESHKRNERCLGGMAHLNAGIRIAVCVGTMVIFGLFAALYFKFRKALFLLLIPTIVTATTVAAIVGRRHHLVWPIIATSLFHVVLACYALLVFSFYFFFKPLYIIMVLNWAFDTLHTDKTESYYIHCSVIFAILIVFLMYNGWQAAICISYLEYLRMQQPTTTITNKPTVLIVNKSLY